MEGRIRAGMPTINNELAQYRYKLLEQSHCCYYKMDIDAEENLKAFKEKLEMM